MRQLVEQWAPLQGYLTRQLPVTSDSWSNTESPVARYIRQLKKTGLEDPTKATEFFDQAVQFRDAYQRFAAKQSEESNLSQRMAEGEISYGDASKQLAKMAATKDGQDKAERERQMLSNATRASYSQAVRAIHNFGEDNWIAILHPLAVAAFETRDQRQWDAVHNMGALLRDPNLAGLSMIAHAQSGHLEFRDTWRYKVGRPDLYHFWMTAHAERAENIQVMHGGPVTYIASAVIKGPQPTVTDMDPSWQPGLYSAQQVLAIAKEIVEEQEAIRMASQPAPTHSKMRAS